MFLKFIISILFTFLFVGCSKTTIVLLDSGKSHNAIIVSTDKGHQDINKTGSFVELTDKKEAPTKVSQMSQEDINKRFAMVLNATPKKPKSYLLYFEAYSTTLTKESEVTLLKSLKTIEEYAPCMVDVIGHTDTTGSNAVNIKVSLKRAKYIQNLIEKKGVKVIAITAKGYGEEDLLVPTPDNTVEAKNRTVEIFIR